MKNIIESIKSNKPIFIKNFLSKYNFDKNQFITYLKKTDTADIHYYAKGVFLKKIDDFDFIKNIKNELNSNNNLIFDEKIRYWIHPKNNYTPNHYDGNGTNVINICFSGKKKFILTPPNSQINFSLSNISLINTSSDEEKFQYVLEENDLLLIPSFWYHEVHCLEDDTITINICFIDNNVVIPDKQKVKYFMHDKLCTVMNNSIVNISESQEKCLNLIFEYCLEIVSLIIIFIIFEMIGSFFNIYLTEIILLFLILFSGSNSKKYGGIIDIITFNFFIIYLVYMVYYHFSQ